MKAETFLEVIGVHEKSCACLLEKTLSKVNGIEKVCIDCVEEKIRMVFDSEKVSLEEIGFQIKKAGFSLCEPGARKIYYNFSSA